jgi:hypothetical protein
MKNPNLAHVAVGDRILQGGAETEVAAVLADGAKLADGRVFAERDFFSDDILVLPKEAPAAMTMLIDAQPVRRARNLVTVRSLCGLLEPQFTIADRKTGALLRASIHSEEEADVSFARGVWEEGKPGLAECWTEYFVGDEEFRVPEDFEPERYQ